MAHKSFCLLFLALAWHCIILCNAEPTKVSILIPTTSRTKLPHCDHCLNLFTVAISSIVKAVPPNDDRYNYTIYVGYDKGDTMWDNPSRLSSIMNMCDYMLRGTGINFKPIRVVPFPDPNKASLTNVWNHLAQQALLDGSEYFFVSNDDLAIYTFDIFHRLIMALKKNRTYPGLGEVAPVDRKFADIAHPTFPMVSRVHFAIFGHMYPTDIFARGCDTWLADVYRDFGAVTTLPDVHVGNYAYSTERRFSNDFNLNKFKDWVVTGRRAVKDFLNERGLRKKWNTDLCSVKMTHGC